MFVRIYQPAVNAMQSGQGNSALWILEYAPASKKPLDPLMGWTGSRDTSSQVKMKFNSKDNAVAFAESNGIAYKIFEPTKRKHIIRKNGYSSNFMYDRRRPWTH